MQENYQKPFRPSLALRLRTLMDQRNLIQKELGQAIGVSQATVSNWLKGVIPGGADLLRLAQLFGVTMEWLLVGTPGKSVLEDVAAHQPEAIRERNELRGKLQILGSNIADLEAFLGNAQPFPVLQKGIVLQPTGEGEASTNLLTSAIALRNIADVESALPDLRKRLEKATQRRGKKAELSRLLGTPRSNITRWLSGERRPDAATASKLLLWLQQQEREGPSAAGANAGGADDPAGSVPAKAPRLPRKRER